MVYQMKFCVPSLSSTNKKVTLKLMKKTNVLNFNSCSKIVIKH